ncbi:hypothetical protein BDN70DRAFT_871089 [Pholiota conissans]|uniref:F-box domain-containing protein n=1 Tax=Pholiota conissans TaxID=109636 RepID=A0A9P5ZE29_9AGAR|nr:hypothetical protein BDN70DRAFT_871089 [Pholiota conissans]
MFVPIPSANICDLTSRSSRYIAQTVCRTWKNFDRATWHLRPEIIDLRPDGGGTISSSFTIFTATGPISTQATQKFTWRLSWDGPRGMEDMDEDALYDTMPKLMKSTKAWTYRPWTSEHRLVPAYLYIELAGKHSLDVLDPLNTVNDFTIGANAGVRLPAELIEDIFRFAALEEVAATELLRVCKWTRELVLQKRRRERFSVLTKRFAAMGLAFWMSCGHFNPSRKQVPKSLFGFRAQVFKFPVGQFDNEIWDTTWDERPLYYSCELPVPEQPESALRRIMEGVKPYDEHPEVQKDFDV